MLCASHGRELRKASEEQVGVKKATWLGVVEALERENLSLQEESCF
jgi:hypothetical protein